MLLSLQPRLGDQQLEIAAVASAIERAAVALAAPAAAAVPAIAVANAALGALALAAAAEFPPADDHLSASLAADSLE